jgi:hypothetical protein
MSHPFLEFKSRTKEKKNEEANKLGFSSTLKMKATCCFET